MQRRTFLQTSGYLAVGTLLPMRAAGCEKKQTLETVGLQLYTVRDAMQRDAADTLRRVHEIGYHYVESAGYNNGQLYGQSAKVFKALMDENELTMPSAHVGWEAMRDDPERAAATFSEAGAEFVVVPWLGEDMRNAAGYAKLVGVLNVAGPICKKYGLQLAYHNHDFEFDTLVANQKPMDFILQETDADTVKIELDLYWITRAGSDYQAYFRQHPGRFPLWHVKDMDNTPDRFFSAVGSGTLDWPTIFQQQDTAGMRYFFVEQDAVKSGLNPMDEIAKSFAYLDKLKY